MYRLLCGNRSRTPPPLPRVEMRCLYGASKKGPQKAIPSGVHKQRRHTIRLGRLHLYNTSAQINC
ncbi:hypothetical protein COCMIDRAFT_105054 [Bipolaris oryzae ATCC 44560]|uniref:Uncharacterized protein n=1 Tax=Bipolaris oryzae ATCC 44560 TaxID=930090 RepID=W6ZE95_COCMI|nr:uncharacterized protein COCMIDRAFT_105054 [Bipolaris oryzae ATCC 44560]EUC41851.1 hypothetical protein COCMIDRAFT_105054 [Bipolaris oryzae ATCC 44560]